MQNGTLFAAPMPKEFAAQGATIKAAVEQAIKESEENGVSKKGKEVTPWLLARVVELTKGLSLQNSEYLLEGIYQLLTLHVFVDLALLENTAVIGMRLCQFSRDNTNSCAICRRTDSC